MSDATQHPKSGSLIEWVMPLAFIAAAAWLTWHMPAFILDFGGPNDQLSALYASLDLTPNLHTPLTPNADIIDWTALISVPILFVFGARTVRRAPMEFESWRAADRSSVFIGRVTMMLVVLLTSVMMFEVVLRYVFEAPTLWANELSLWLAGFVFLCAGLYAMQQRSHIRIFLLYDMMPRSLQRVCDVISTLLIVTFTFFLIYGGYGEAFTKFMRWETFGTAFDPPIPATLKPMVLIVVALVAVQAVVNLFSDWNAEPVMHSAADDIDADEIERLKKAVGADGIGDMDVTRSAVQHTKAGQD
ncbi:TRAP-type mannitol/chloroaromatic compound transport system, small permease component [Litoreibacter ascidiaceicola]|uniref:TRAP transporter small permease protein n=1 Tax=Litoreibacter ascidiaceicola TaxID=1486859 RepID=A0A1M4ZR24_9RHOB|nr:TRAP transporter small permease [Litoreibacter ascidiaceicola]SHF20454.1 TRAP-type mannitol/chloroaromatic compound transport system, small permease component [Litoreibacter ascidiaceicola]